jgi:hypothetical protein
MEGHLQKSYPFPLRCYVLTIVEQQSKISDHLLVHRSKGWAVFNDDVRLEDYAYGSLHDAIKQLHGMYPFTTIHRAA